METQPQNQIVEQTRRGTKFIAKTNARQKKNTIACPALYVIGCGRGEGRRDPSDRALR